MNRTIHTVLQILGLVINIGTMATDIVPPKWKPYVVATVGAAQGILAWYNHSFNTDGTPQTVAFVAKILILFLLLSGVTMAQTPSPLFSISTQAVAIRIGRQTVPGTDVIGSFNLTPRVQLQTDNLLAPANNFQGYLGGAKWYPSFLSKPFTKTSLSSVSPYFHGAIGIVRNVPATGPATQHYGTLAGAGFDWNANGTFSVGPRVEYLNAPGQCPPGVAHCSPHGVAVSANLQIVLARK